MWCSFGFKCARHPLGVSLVWQLGVKFVGYKGYQVEDGMQPRARFLYISGIVNYARSRWLSRASGARRWSWLRTSACAVHAAALFFSFAIEICGLRQDCLKKKWFPNFRSYKKTQRDHYLTTFLYFIIVLTSNTFNQSSVLFGTSRKTFVVAYSEVCAYLDHNSPLKAKLNLPQI